MDKRKLIGTIIGVAMFAALIAGATYAFLSFTATVTNATYNGTTMNFLVDYTKGTDISSLPQVKTGTPANTSYLVVNAKKHNNSVDGYLTVKLTTTSTGTLTTGGLVNWVLCKGACTTDFSTKKASGTITAGGNNTITLWTDTEQITTAGTDYYVYFWIDSSLVSNSHINQTYSGYIHASATQKTE